MSRLDTFIRFPLAAAMLAAMTSVTGCESTMRETQPHGTDMAITDLPQPAQETIRKEAGDAPVTITAVENIHGKHSYTYTVETVKEGRHMNMQITEGGALRVVETEIPIEDLPVFVKRTADAETLGYPNRSFAKKVENGQTMYVIHAATNIRGKMLLVDETGRIIKRDLKNV